MPQFFWRTTGSFPVGWHCAACLSDRCPFCVACARSVFGNSTQKGRLHVKTESIPQRSPGCNQPQSTGEQGFNFNGHVVHSLKCSNSRSMDLCTTRQRVAHKLHRAHHYILFLRSNSTRNDEGPKPARALCRVGLVRRIERGLKASSKFSGLNGVKSSIHLKNRISGETGTKRAHFRHKTGAILEKNEKFSAMKNPIQKRTDEKNPL